MYENPTCRSRNGGVACFPYLENRFNRKLETHMFWTDGMFLLQEANNGPCTQGFQLTSRIVRHNLTMSKYSVVFLLFSVADYLHFDKNLPLRLKFFPFFSSVLEIIPEPCEPRNCIVYYAWTVLIASPFMVHSVYVQFRWSFRIPMSCPGSLLCYIYIVSLVDVKKT